MKTCLSCKHCYADPGEPGYSAYTPGTPMDFFCKKNHWDLYDRLTIPQLRSVLLTAEKCKDYQRDENLPPPISNIESWS